FEGGVHGPCPAGRAGGAAGPPGRRRFAVRIGIDEAAQSAAIERSPAPFGLGEAVGDRVERDRVVTEAAMAALDLDVLGVRTLALETSLPRDDAVAAAEDRGRRHRWRRLHAFAAGVVVDAALADVLVEPPR